MANGHDASDWTVEHTGDEGTIRSTDYRGRFRIDRRGVIQLIWQDGPEPQDHGPVSQAAKEAIEAAIRPRA
jgi:peroxiredoxin